MHGQQNIKIRYVKFLLHNVQTHRTSNELQEAYRTSSVSAVIWLRVGRPGNCSISDRHGGFRGVQTISGAQQTCRFGIAKSFP